jgi:hypothetical protein
MASSVASAITVIANGSLCDIVILPGRDGLFGIIIYRIGVFHHAERCGRRDANRCGEVGIHDG